MKLHIKKLFLENISFKQTIFKNTFWLAAAEAISGFLRLSLYIYVARTLGATEYGKFAFAISFVSMMVIFSNLGITDIITREFARNKEREKDFPAVLVLQITLSLATFILMVVSSFFITSDPIVQKTIWILSVFILITGFYGIFYSFLRSRQRMEGEAGIKIGQSLIMFGLVFLALYYRPSIVSLAYMYLLSNVIMLTLVVILFSIFIQPIKLVWDKNIFTLLKISWPLALTNTTVWFYASISSIVLGYFNLNTENGLYNAASRITVILILPATLIIASFYPVLSNFFITSKEKIQKSWDYLMQIMIFLAIPLVMGGIALAPKIIDFFYDAEFIPSIFAFQVLIFLVGLNFINYPYSLMLIVADHQKRNFFLVMVGIITNIILNLVLVSMYGLNGAILATSISSTFTLIASMILVKHLIPLSVFDVKLSRGVLVATFTGFVMVRVLYQPVVYRLGIFYLVIIGMFVYFLTLFLCYKFFKKFAPALIFFKR